jgi:hypothetical protein
MPPEFNPRRVAAIFALVGVILGCLGTYCAISGERSGSTRPIDDDRVPTASISRDSSPKEFRRTNNKYWAAAVFGFGIGAIGVYYSLRSRDGD